MNYISFFTGVDFETLGAKALNRLTEIFEPYTIFKFDQVEYYSEELVAKCSSRAVLDAVNQ